MSSTEGEGQSISAQEAADLRSAFADMQAAFQELREAQTAKEKEAAREDVADARDDLDAVARKLGISRETLENAAKEAKRTERRDELRPIVAELLAEAQKTDDDDGKSDDDDGKTDDDDKADDKSKPKVEKDKAPPPPEPDKEPTAEHWGERKIGQLIR